MTKSFSYTGSHPLEEVVKDLTTDRDEWRARAERAEAEAAELRAELDAARESVEMLRLALALTPNPNVKIDTASTASFRWPPHDDEEARAAQEWRPNDDQALFEDKDIEGEIILTATFQQRNHCWSVDGISILPSGVVGWRRRTAAPGDGDEEG